MNKGQLFQNSKKETFEFIGMAGKSIIGKKTNGKCAYMFNEINGQINQGVRIPQPLSKGWL